MGGRLPPRMVAALAATALLAMPAGADARKNGFDARLPKAGGITITQTVVKKPGKAPRPALGRKRGLPKDVWVIAAVRKVRHKRGTYLVRIAIARRGKHRSRAVAHAAQDFGLAPVVIKVPGVTNLGAVAGVFLGGPLARPQGLSGFCPADVAAADFDLAPFRMLAGDSAAFGGFEPFLLGLPETLCDVKNPPALTETWKLLGGADPGPFFMANPLSLSFAPADVAAGDVNGDGRTDLFAAGVTKAGAGRLAIFSGVGDGTFGVPQTVPLTSAPFALATGDIDLDGLTDLAIGEAGGIETFSGGSLGLHPLGIGSDGIDLVGLVDLNGDGSDDVIAGGVGGLRWSPGDGHGVFGSPNTIFGDRPAGLTFGRVNDDPLNDVIAAEPGAGASTQLGTWSTANPFAPLGGVPGPPTGEIVIDPTNPNIVYIGTGGPSPHIYVLDADTGAVQVILAPPTGPVGIIPADVNKDGIVDVLSLNRGSGTISTFLGSPPPGDFSSPRTTFAGLDPVAFVPFAPQFGGMGTTAVADKTGPGAGAIRILNWNAISDELLDFEQSQRIPPADTFIGSDLTRTADVTRAATVDITQWAKKILRGFLRSAPRAAAFADAVTQAGRITQFALRGHGTQPSGTPVRFRTLRPQPDGSWLPVLTSKFVTLPPEDGVHVYPTADLDPNGANAFPVQPGDAIAVFQGADAPGHAPGDPTDWTIFANVPGAEMYEVSAHGGFTEGHAETPTTVDGLEVLLQATVEPVACTDSSTPYDACAAKLSVDARKGGTPHLGKPLTVVDEVRNAGPATAEDVTLTHGFPAGAKVGALPPGCAQTGNAPPVVRCTIGKIEWNADIRRELSFTFTPTKRGKAVTSARVASPTFDPVTADDTDAYVQTVRS